MRRSRIALAGGLLLAVAVAGCRQDMHNQPKITPLRGSAFFPDGRGARPLEPNTVARSDGLAPAAYSTGKDGEAFVARAPIPVSTEVLARGRVRYDAFCSPCHDRVGTGQGMIVQRGYRRPSSFHDDRLRREADGYFFNAITNGFGVMPGYAQQVPVADRWAITLYVRALQLSQAATLADVPEAERARLEAERAAP